MNRYPPFQGRGFGYGPNVATFHQHATNSPLEWATFALVVLLVLMFGAVLVARFAGRGHRHGPKGFRRRYRFGGPQMMMRHGPGPGPDALDVLRMRFASGQITRDEFLQATSDLTAGGPPPSPPEG
jgi:uncharacterized membrane protein